MSQIVLNKHFRKLCQDRRCSKGNGPKWDISHFFYSWMKQNHHCRDIKLDTVFLIVIKINFLNRCKYTCIYMYVDYQSAQKYYKSTTDGLFWRKIVLIPVSYLHRSTS